MTKTTLKNDTMPHFAKVAWSMTDGSASKGLNAYKIIRAAIEIADYEGISAVTIRSIAKKTGFSTMAIYRHIESRDELMTLLVEAALGPAPALTSETWQDGVRDWAKKLLEQYTIHPWVLELPIAGIPATPNHISWVELILRILAPTGLALQGRLDVALLIDSHVRQFANIPTPSEVRVSHSNDLRWLQEAATDIAPTLMLALQQGVMQSQKGPDFAVGIDIIIRGIEES